MKFFRIMAGCALAVSVSTVAVADELETAEQRLSYTIGMDIGGSLAEQGIELDLDVLVEALRASYTGEETLLTEAEALAERDAFMQRRQQEMEGQRAEESSANLEAGQAFLAGNRDQDGVTETESGLQYRV